MTTVTLYTPIISFENAPTNKLKLFCHVLNASNQPRNGSIQIMDAGGNPISSTGYHNLQPGNATGDSAPLYILSSTALIGLIYAKVTVIGAAHDIRANLILTDSNGNTIVSVEAH